MARSYGIECAREFTCVEFSKTILRRAMLASTLLLLCAAPLLFGDEELGWFVLNERGDVLQRYSDFGGEAAAEAAISPDQSTIVFTSSVTRGPQQLLRWRPGEPKPTPLSPTSGHFAHPAFSPDAEWVFFVHNGSGPPGAHDTSMSCAPVDERLT